MVWIQSVLFFLVNAVAALPSSPRSSKPRYIVHEDRAEAVRQAFEISWEGYLKYAFPHDALLPVSNNYSDYRNGWGATAVDALSTAIIMKDEKVTEQILDHIAKIDFSKSVGDVSLFETTIRYLGGLLSGYDLLKGPFKGLAGDETSLQTVLDQAKNLADNLKVGFNTKTGIPDNVVLFDPPRIAGSSSNGLATAGTLILEWKRLSDLTGDPTYGQLAEKAEQYLLHPFPLSGEPFPGLVGGDVNITNGHFLNGNGGWIGGSDSFYEYLIKMYLYDPSTYKEYKDRWVLAADSSIRHLASHPLTRPDLTFLAEYQNTTLIFESEHLACFDGGNFILGGLTLDRPDYVAFGIALTESCGVTYETASGIGPEVFRWQDNGRKAPRNATNNPAPPANQTEFVDSTGIWVTASTYQLRPEVVESFYYAYRATGDPKYQDWAWEAFLAVNRTCHVGSGYSSIKDVTKADGGGFSDFQESFWFAEVLKYFYLIQAEDGDWQVQPDHSNQFVYNTECHPVLIPGGER